MRFVTVGGEGGRGVCLSSHAPDPTAAGGGRGYRYSGEEAVGGTAGRRIAAAAGGRRRRLAVAGRRRWAEQRAVSGGGGRKAAKVERKSPSDCVSVSRVTGIRVTRPGALITMVCPVFYRRLSGKAAGS